MIITLTPNPSIDRAMVIDALRRGEVHRATSSRIDPGGKGVNVSRALSAQGSPTVAVLPAGGPEGHLMEELLDAAGVARRSVPVAGSLRMNISVLEPDGTTTKLNEQGPRSRRPRSTPSWTPPSTPPTARRGSWAAAACPPGLRATCMPRSSPGRASAGCAPPSTPRAPP